METKITKVLLLWYHGTRLQRIKRKYFVLKYFSNSEHFGETVTTPRVPFDFHDFWICRKVQRFEQKQLFLYV